MNALDFNSVFSIFPDDLNEALEKSYTKIVVNYKERRFEPSELNGAKFCEVVYRILEWHTDPQQNYTPLGQHIRRFGQSCKIFENKSQFSNTIRFHIPRLLISLYDIRNKRGVGHVGGDVDPNLMDATLVLNISKWILADLVRIFHRVTTTKAQEMVENLIMKEFPIIWEIKDKKRVLDTSLSTKQNALILHYSVYPNSISDRDLFEWIEYSNFSVFKRRILKVLHEERFIEYINKDNDVYLSPKGIKFVEDNIDLNI